MNGWKMRIDPRSTPLPLFSFRSTLNCGHPAVSPYILYRRLELRKPAPSAFIPWPAYHGQEFESGEKTKQ
eukprot:1140026-Pelagomonas_calceolata.AAC.3